MSELTSLFIRGAARLRAAVGSLTLVLVLSSPGAAAGKEGVLSTFLQSRAASPPSLTVLQEVNDLGQLRYTRIAEEIMNYPIVAYGGCNTNFRADVAWVNQCFQHLDGTVQSLEICPGPVGFGQGFHVDTAAKKFGPSDELLVVPTTKLLDQLTSAGETLIQNLSELSGFSPAFVRSLDLRIEVKWPLAFYMGCRRWAGNNAKAYQSSFVMLPIDVTFRGASPAAPPFRIAPVPPGQPDVPIPFGELTHRVQIEQAHLSILPNDDRDECGFYLSGVFRTNAPTRVTYRLIDALGARSPAFAVDVDQSNTAFFSHDIVFAPKSGETLGLSLVPGNSPNPAGGVAFAGSFVNVPTDRLQGYYRVETIEPHRAMSNIVSYNLANCTGGDGPASLSFNARVVGEWNSVLEAFRRADETYGTAE